MLPSHTYHVPLDCRTHVPAGTLVPSVALEQVEGGFRIPSIKLTLVGRVPGLSKDEFLRHANAAKANCPVSKVLNAEITLDATFEG